MSVHQARNGQIWVNFEIFPKSEDIILFRLQRLDLVQKIAINRFQEGVFCNFGPK